MNRNSDKEFSPNASELNHNAYKFGCVYFNEGQFKKAAKAFIESIEYWSEDPQAWFALGNCYDELNKAKKAEECFKEALRFTAPNKQADILFNLGNSLLDQEKFIEAIEYYSKVPAQCSAYRAAQNNMTRAKNGNPNKNS